MYFYDTEFFDTGSAVHLISIGIVRDDGAEYEACVRDAPWEQIYADPWLDEHVVPHLPPMAYRLPRERVSQDVYDFLTSGSTTPSLWSWFSAYNHLCLTQLFGRIVEVPAGIPHRTNDLAQLVSMMGVRSLPDPIGVPNRALDDARTVKTRFEYLQDIAAQRSGALAAARR